VFGYDNSTETYTPVAFPLKETNVRVFTWFLILGAIIQNLHVVHHQLVPDVVHLNGSGNWLEIRSHFTYIITITRMLLLNNL
jgi:hypothetical protein